MDIRQPKEIATGPACVLIDDHQHQPLVSHEYEYNTMLYCTVRTRRHFNCGVIIIHNRIVQDKRIRSLWDKVNPAQS